MPKDALTPKAIAKMIKAKGLQKLRWYCQICQKQCRDANGFKCHTESESHRRNLALVAANPSKHIDQFSKEFESGFLDILKRQFHSKRVHANIVYNEYIRDRDHTHMNSTKWVTLTAFVKHLGKSGKCKVEESPRGWYLTYIEQDFDELSRKAKMDKKEKSDLDDEERVRKEIEKRALKMKKAEEMKTPQSTELKREEEEGPVKIGFSFGAKTEARPKFGENDEMELETKEKEEPQIINGDEEVNRRKENRSVKKLSALDAIMAEEERKKEKTKRKDYWLFEGIVVKVMNKKLADGKYYKEKGVVVKIIDRYVGVIELDSGDVIKIDQEQLETVIPNIGRRVRVVNGAYRGAVGIMQSVDVANFVGKVKLDSGPNYGDIVALEYEDMSRLDNSVPTNFVQY